MDSFFDDPFRFFDGKALAEFNTDIIESGNNYILEADLPGFEKATLSLMSRTISSPSRQNVTPKPRKGQGQQEYLLRAFLRLIFKTV